MAHAVHAILEFLHRHDFSVAENALRSELTAREKGNGPLPVAFYDDFDLGVNKQFNAMQGGHPVGPELFSPEPMTALSSPDDSKASDTGFNFSLGLQEVHDRLKFNYNSFSVPANSGFADSGFDEVESLNLLASPRLLKSGFLPATTMNMERTGLDSEGNAGENNLPLLNGTRSLSGGAQDISVVPIPKQRDDFVKEQTSQKESPKGTLKHDELAFQNGAEDVGELVTIQLIESVVERELWKAGDVDFEDIRLVGSQQTNEGPVEQVGSQHWIGFVEQGDSVLHLPISPNSQWMMTKNDSGKWKMSHGISDEVQEEYAINDSEKPVLVRDLIASERAPVWHIVSGHADSLHHQNSGGVPPLNGSKQSVVENGSFARNYVVNSPWKDVPLQAGRLLPAPEFLTPLPLMMEPHIGERAAESYSKDDEASPERTNNAEALVVSHSGRSSRERAKSADCSLKVFDGFSSSFLDVQEELPQLPPVRLRSEAALGLGSYLDIPVGQDVSMSGARRLSGSSRQSVSQGIVEDASERLSGFATARDGQGEALVEYPDEFWDSDTYEDDDDPGYHRQPIEDEEWFLAHEIDYPDERSSPGLESSQSHHDKDYDDILATWKQNSNESSPIISPRNETLQNLILSADSTISGRSTDNYGSGEVKGDVDKVDTTDINTEEADAVAADDEEAAAVQEQICRIRAEEEEFETFNLKIVHRRNRTGFEEDKDFPVIINSVIAGRYHVTEYLGSAAFSKAIQAHDLHTGMDVCMKIIKNSKDFFDQSLDEIKLLKYINKHDPGDKYHVLRLYDYFYHREHLFIVCELLRANLYEFHKYNRESGGEVYFTMPRLQSITRQCLEALDFIHGLKLIHCDLKPENILVKSYSRCEVKVIDLGSSCFQTDHLCSYVQSRSYRAPEVILGLPYDQKIDMWSLGCILAELCSGNVLFQNDSIATLLARVVGILGPVDPEMLAKGRDTHKFFTKNHILYERNQDTEQLEYLLPKKTSLAHRLPMGDQGFVDFVGYLLQVNPAFRPSARDALKHPWLSYPYDPISA